MKRPRGVEKELMRWANDPLSSANRHETALKFAKEQLIIMDGSLKAAMRRIGTERFEKLVKDIEWSLP